MKSFIPLFVVLIFFSSCKSDVSVTGVFLTQNLVTLDIGDNLTLEALIKPNDATNKNVSWKSNKPDIVEVSNAGSVTAVSPGTAVITVTTQDGNKTADCTVIVNKKDIVVEPPDDRTIITGYLPEYRINISAPGDLTYLSVPDRIYFFNILPDAQGDWYLEPSILSKINIVKGAMTSGQEIFIVVGGGASAINMHIMGASATKREEFAEAIVNFAHANNFNGIDLDWEPDWSQSPATKVPLDQFVDLMTRIRNKMNALPETTTLKKLTTAIGTQQDSRELALAVVNIIDQINVMLYDIYGTSSEGFPHVPMYMFKELLENFVTDGIPKDKLLGGVPFYGGNRTVSPTQNKTYQELYNNASAAGTPLTASVNSFDNFAFNGVNLIKEKTRYVIDNDFAGMMIWELGQDIPYDNYLSLLRAMKETIVASY